MRGGRPLCAARAACTLVHDDAIAESSRKSRPEDAPVGERAPRRTAHGRRGRRREARDPLKPVREGKFRQDVLWNFASLAVLGISGIALNVVIGSVYDEAVLGVFNQALAAYIFFSQIAVGGINLSALRAIAEHAHDRAKVSSIIAGSLAPTFALAAITTLAYFLARGAIADWLDSQAVARGIAASAPGLFFFALNKVQLAVVNGVQRMRAFAVYQALRYFLILLGLIGFVVFDGERTHGADLAFVFTIAEGLLFVILAIEVGRCVTFPIPGDWRAWSVTHLRYGVKSVFSGVLLELNARVDVLMIGHFMQDSAVGIYTCAAMIAEGVYQLLVVLQNVYNPILAREIAAKRFDALIAMVRKGRRWTYLAMLGVGALAVVLYPHAVHLAFPDKPDFAQSWWPFIYLMLGILLASGYIPFANTLLMAGHPGWHTGYMVVTVMCNVIGNWLLIPILGLEGAAISTANSMFLSIFVLKALVRNRVGLKL